MEQISWFLIDYIARLKVFLCWILTKGVILGLIKIYVRFGLWEQIFFTVEVVCGFYITIWLFSINLVDILLIVLVISSLRRRLLSVRWCKKFRIFGESILGFWGRFYHVRKRGVGMPFVVISGLVNYFS